MMAVISSLNSDEEFRRRVVEVLKKPEDLDEPSRLFLLRPDGWKEELSALAEVQAEDSERRDKKSAEVDARRKLAGLETALEKSRSELAESRVRADVAERELADVSSELGQMKAAAVLLSEELDEATGERQQAVRQLKTSEALATARLAKIRALEASVRSASARAGTDPSGDSGNAPGTDELGGRAAELAARESEVELAEKLLNRLSGAITGVLSELESLGPPVAPATTRPAVSSHRRALRLGRGVPDDSRQGLADLLDHEPMCVFVDGYNVSKSAWPQLSIADQRDQLIAMLGRMKSRTSADVHLVFDGDSTGARPNVSVPYPVRVHFTEDGVEADDRILEFLDDLDARTPALVISSDRRVRDGSRERGANVISSRVLIEFCRRG